MSTSYLDLDFERFRRAIERADQHATIEKMRAFQDAAVAEYAGRHHEFGGDLACKDAIGSTEIPKFLHGVQPDSPLGEMARTYLAHLTADGFQPKAVPAPGQEPLPAHILTARMNVVADDTNMEQRASEYVLDAILGIGIGQMRLNRPDMPRPFGTARYKTMQPYLWRVPVDRYIPDPTCDGDLTRAMYVASRYLVDRSELLELSPPEMHDWLGKLPAFYQTDRCAEHEADLFTADMVELIDVEIMHRGKRYCATMPHYADNADGWIVEPYEHFGPEHESMYVPLALGFVPGSGQPISPAMVLFDAHIAASALAARAVEEGWTARRKIIYKPEAMATIAAIMDRRGDSAIQGNPDALAEQTFGGMTEPVVQAYAFATALVNRFGPSVLQAKGVNSGADTATGDTIKAGNANVVFNAWRARRDTSLNGLVSRMGWYLNAIPQEPMILPIPLPNGEQISVQYDPAMMVGMDLASQRLVFKAVTGGKTPMDPRMRQRSLVELLGQIVPFIQAVAATGGDPSGAIRALGDAWEWPELSEIFPTADAAAFAQAVQQLAQRGSNPSLGPSSRQGQMQSDYAPAMAQ